ncbi:hypothetical protein [Salinibacter altiplanensis]|uniref:hypothetical protein n=1 Tax=Salinibacter altiplanensis TaxID=1803181 RepID=UPI000C9ED946|nr:hypothetical protein [Salinibacter altiplanensis]
MSRSARSKHVDPFETGSLEAWGGIVSGRIVDFAEEVGVSPSSIEAAAEQMPLLVDTSTPKGRNDEDRPDTPELRCIAVEQQHLGELTETARRVEGQSSHPDPAT